MLKVILNDFHPAVLELLAFRSIHYVYALYRVVFYKSITFSAVFLASIRRRAKVIKVILHCMQYFRFIFKVFKRKNIEAFPFHRFMSQVAVAPLAFQ